MLQHAFSEPSMFSAHDFPHFILLGHFLHHLSISLLSLSRPLSLVSAIEFPIHACLAVVVAWDTAFVEAIDLPSRSS